MNIKIKLAVALTFLFGMTGIALAEESDVYLKAIDQVQQLRADGKKIDEEMARKIIFPVAEAKIDDQSKESMIAGLLIDMGLPPAIQKKLRESIPIEVRKQKAKKYIKAHPNIDKKIKDMILAGEISVGMSREEAKASWGEPEDINRTVGSFGVHEQWIYFGGEILVYFENGRLTGWQD